MMNNKNKNEFFLNYMKKQQEKQDKIEHSLSAKSPKPNSFRYRCLSFLEVAFDLFNKILFNLLSSKRTIRLLAFILALAFYVSVYDGNTKGTESYRVADVPVKVVNLSDDYIVEGIPDTVYMYLDGSSVQIQLALLKGFNAYCDLQKLTEGNYDNIPLYVTDIYGGAETTVIPEKISIQIYKKEKQDFNLTYRFINEDTLPEDVVVQTPTLPFSTITAYGKASDLEKIAKIDCVIDLDGVSSSSSVEGVFKAYDSYDQEISTIQFDQDSVVIHLQTSKAKKEITIRPLFIGLSDQYAISSITYSSPIYYYGDPEELEQYSELKLDVNLNDMDSNYTISDIPLNVPEGIVCSESKISVSLTFETRETRTFTNVPINVKGLEDGQYQLSTTNVVVKLSGAITRLSQITLEDLNVYVTVSDVNTKNQKLDLNIKCSDPLITAEIVDQKEVELEIVGS